MTRVTAGHDESDALHEMARDLKRRLVMLGLGRVTGIVPDEAIDVGELRERLDEARGLVDTGVVQYVRTGGSLGPMRPATDRTPVATRLSPASPA